jgi:Arc/MetJ family transcription regulator
MRTTLHIDDALLAEARRLTGISAKTSLVEQGLRALIAQEARRRLAALRGSQPDARAPRRRRLKTKR